MRPWYRHPLFAQAYRWRGFLASGCGLAGWACLRGLPAQDGGRWSLVPLALGLSLRVWARRHIGLHTRGRVLEAPYRARGGPYRLLAHPLYLANVLVGIGCLGALGRAVGASFLAALPLALLYVCLGRGEGTFVAASGAPARHGAVERPGWSKEFWSLAPPVGLWALLRAFG